MALTKKLLQPIWLAVVLQCTTYRIQEDKDDDKPVKPLRFRDTSEVEAESFLRQPKVLATALALPLIAETCN